MARRQVLGETELRQLDALLHAGVTQTVAARVLGVSRRTVQRALGRRRRERPETLAELLAALPPLDVVLALPAPAPAPRRNLRGDDWQAAATELETQFPDRWRRS